ncbi:MAG: BatA domain-containing protein [Pirellulales bacterium]
MNLSGLEILSPSMLGWLVVIVLPWWIHRWWSRRPQQIPWAAMQLLHEAIRVRSRQVRLGQWMLLVLRTLILLLIALAAAQPVLRQVGWNIGQNARMHLLLLIDQSYSMGCRLVDENGQSGLSRFAQARQLARQIIRSAPADTQFSVLGWAGKAKKASAVKNWPGYMAIDAAAALSAVDQLQVSHTSAQLNVGLQAALQTILHARQVLSKETNHQVCVVSDLGNNTWEDAATSNEVQTLCQQLQAQCELWVLPLELPLSSSEIDSHESRRPASNVAITRVTTETPLLSVRMPITIEASLRAFGLHSNSVTHVELSIDGQRVAQHSLDLSDGEEGVVRFEAQLVDPGQHVVHVSCQPHDDLPLDDEHWRMLEVHRQVHVLCLEGQRAAATDLTRALISQPKLSTNAMHPSTQPLFRVDQIAVSRLAEADLSQYDAVLACNVAQIQRQQTQRLTDYVHHGGALLIFLGDDGNPSMLVAPGATIRQDILNRSTLNRSTLNRSTLNRSTLNRSTGALLLPQIPVQMGPAIEVQGVHWDPLEYRHPLIAPFRDHPNAGFTQVSVAKYVKITLLQSEGHDLAQPSWSTAFAFDTGDPAIVMGTLGVGRVAVVALPGSLAARNMAGMPWSSWAVSPSFLPMVRDLLKQVIAREGQDRFNRLVGEPLELPRSKLGTEAAASKLWVKTPLGKDVLSTDEHVLLSATDRCGIYSILSEKSPNRVNFRYAANLHAINPDTGRGESDLTTVRPNQLPPSFPLTPSAVTQRDNRELPLGSTLFGAALIGLLCEQCLAWSMGRSWG